MTKREKAIANEAFMIGRIYAANGEKERPSEIHDKLMAKCKLVGGRNSSGAAVVSLPSDAEISDESEKESQNYSPFPCLNHDPGFLRVQRSAFKHGFQIGAHYIKDKAK